MIKQFIKRFGSKKIGKSRVIHTGRVANANTTKRQERKNRQLRPKRKTRLTR